MTSPNSSAFRKSRFSVMGRMPTLRAGAVIRALQHLGFDIIRQSGSHVTLRHRERRVSVSVPDHGAQDLGRGIVRKIVMDAGLDRREFLDALRNT